jgi:hypothetical protein
MSEIDKINELPEPDELSPVNDDSAEYDAGFQAGKAGKPSDGRLWTGTEGGQMRKNS